MGEKLVSDLRENGGKWGKTVQLCSYTTMLLHHKDVELWMQMYVVAAFLVYCCISTELFLLDPLWYPACSSIRYWLKLLRLGQIGQNRGVSGKNWGVLVKFAISRWGVFW